MDSFNKIRLAGIVSVISICSVLAIEIVGNVVGDYITDQLKGWQGSALTSVTETPVTETSAETAGSVILPVTPPTPSEDVARASVGEPQAVPGATPSAQVGADPEAEPAPAQDPLPAQEAALPPPPEALIVPGQGNRAANRAALEQRANKWRAQRKWRSNNRWDTPGYRR